MQTRMLSRICVELISPPTPKQIKDTPHIAGNNFWLIGTSLIKNSRAKCLFICICHIHDWRKDTFEILPILMISDVLC